MNKRRKKKGFTLIELVIVLAVLAIIALIAIPNFTKVRNDSLQKSDVQTAEQIKKITLMAIADEDINVPSSTLSFDVADAGKISNAGAGLIAAASNVEAMLKEVSKPQVNNETHFTVSIDDEGNVTVFDSAGTATLTK